LRAGRVQVASTPGADVAGDAAAAPAEVVRRRDVRQEVEALFVAKVQAGLDQPSRIDDERRLAVRLSGLDEPGNSLERYDATPRIS
jgi:hypothetical protein